MKVNIILTLFFISVNVFCQTNVDRSTADFEKVYILGLRGDVSKALTFLEQFSDQMLTSSQAKVKQEYYKRFKYQNETPAYRTEDELVKVLLDIYRSYWRKGLLNNEYIRKYDSLLTYDVINFLLKRYPKIKEKTNHDLYANFPQYLKGFLSERGIYAATGKTGMFFDLLLHAKETEVLYNVETIEENVKVKVVFMEDIISNGWEEYATFGKYYPGGWATDNALYCIKETYDLGSEKFKVSYLAHEGKHFADYKKFPKLSSPDLEYRAKLVELSFASETLFDLLEFFIRNSNPDRSDAHGLANFCVIRDLSKFIFNEETVTDIGQWKTIPVDSINKAAEMLLKANTRNLVEIGSEMVTEFIK